MLINSRVFDVNYIWPICTLQSDVPIQVIHVCITVTIMRNVHLAQAEDHDRMQIVTDCAFGSQDDWGVASMPMEVPALDSDDSQLDALLNEFGRTC